MCCRNMTGESRQQAGSRQLPAIITAITIIVHFKLSGCECVKQSMGVFCDLFWFNSVSVVRPT